MTAAAAAARTDVSTGIAAAEGAAAAACTCGSACTPGAACTAGAKSHIPVAWYKFNTTRIMLYSSPLRGGTNWPNTFSKQKYS